MGAKEASCRAEQADLYSLSSLLALTRTGGPSTRCTARPWRSGTRAPGRPRPACARHRMAGWQGRKRAGRAGSEACVTALKAGHGKHLARCTAARQQAAHQWAAWTAVPTPTTFSTALRRQRQCRQRYRQCRAAAQAAAARQRQTSDRRCPLDQILINPLHGRSSSDISNLIGSSLHGAGAVKRHLIKAGRGLCTSGRPAGGSGKSGGALARGRGANCRQPKVAPPFASALPSPRLMLNAAGGRRPASHSPAGVEGYCSQRTLCAEWSVNSALV